LTLTMSITHHLQAVYSGDSQFNGSTSAVFTHEVTSP
jgi:hypothetical protein